MSSHWGEIPVIPEADSGIAAIEREQMTKLRPMDIEGPRLHQPSSRHYPPTTESLPAEKFQIDPLTLHTIRLIQHAKKLRSLIYNITQQHQLQQSQDQKLMDYDTSYPDAPPIPEYTGPALRTKALQQPIPFMGKDLESDFVRGKGEQAPEIDNISCRQLLRRSVAANFAHAGYDSCAESLLETLTDITHEYYLQFMKHLRAAADNEARDGPAGFPDRIEQVFHELGIGSVTRLHDFYQKRVLNYHQHMEELCQQLDSEYEKLKEPMVLKQPDTLSVIRIKEEPSEIHFPELDEIDEVNDAEQLLNLESLGGFEITVEHESATGLTTEVESKWSQVKTESSEHKSMSIESFGEPSSERDTDRQTPTPSSGDEDSIVDPGSVNVSDIVSPSSISRPSKAKKKKLADR